MKILNTKFNLLEKFMIGILSILFIACNVSLYKINNHTVGYVVGKYINGDDNDIYHITIKDENKTIDLTTTEGIYNQYNLKDKVYVRYNFLRKIQEIMPKGENNSGSETNDINNSR